MRSRRRAGRTVGASGRRWGSEEAGWARWQGFLEVSGGAEGEWKSCCPAAVAGLERRHELAVEYQRGSGELWEQA